ncbi:MAG: hypothetical protein ACLR43_14645 [Faecalibacillus faecis]
MLSLLKIHDNQLKNYYKNMMSMMQLEEDIKRLFGTNDDQPFIWNIVKV